MNLLHGNECSDEANRIYKTLFKKDIPDILIHRYEEAQSILHQSFSEEDIHKCNLLIDRVNDLEALEYVSRIFNANKLLSRKFELMIWLTSTLPEHYQEYVNEKDQTLFGKGILFLFSLHTVCKFFKGLVYFIRLRNE